RVLELPGGGIAPTEDPLAAAQRELLEETGYTAPKWQPLGAYTVDANRDYGRCYGYLAWHAQQSAEPDDMDLGQGRVVRLRPDDLRRRWLAGDFPVLPSTAIIGLALAHLDKRTFESS
ncbi:MAG: NUDIX domain-containing protein, partial [Chloroflexi bacterium]|nr:NUDIX domain-containing protein [Chloroflexota bacterium]